MYTESFQVTCADVSAQHIHRRMLQILYIRKSGVKRSDKYNICNAKISINLLNHTQKQTNKQENTVVVLNEIACLWVFLIICTNKKSKCSNDPFSPYLQYLLKLFTVLTEPTITFFFFLLLHATLQQHYCTSSSFAPVALSEHQWHSNWNQTVEHSSI